MGFFSALGPLTGRFKVRPCFYPSSQGDPAYVSLRVLENRPDLGRTDRLGRAIQSPLRASVPRAALRYALGYLILPLWGGRIGSRPEARGQRREGTAKQPENFGAILRRYPRITQNAGTLPGYFLRCALVSIPVLKGILLMSRLASSKTAQIWAERIA